MLFASTKLKNHPRMVVTNEKFWVPWIGRPQNGRSNLHHGAEGITRVAERSCESGNDSTAVALPTSVGFRGLKAPQYRFLWTKSWGKKTHRSLGIGKADQTAPSPIATLGRGIHCVRRTGSIWRYSAWANWPIQCLLKGKNVSLFFPAVTCATTIFTG